MSEKCVSGRRKTPQAKSTKTGDTKSAAVFKPTPQTCRLQLKFSFINELLYWWWATHLFIPSLAVAKSLRDEKHVLKLPGKSDKFPSSGLL